MIFYIQALNIIKHYDGSGLLQDINNNIDRCFSLRVIHRTYNYWVIRKSHSRDGDQNKAYREMRKVRNHADRKKLELIRG